MEKEKRKLLNVTDLSSYLYCPRKFFLEKIKGLKKPVSRVMIEGRIRHEILENFSNKEKGLVESLPLSDKEKIISIYNQFLFSLINQTFSKNRNQLLMFKVNPDSLQNKILVSMKKDIELRADSIVNAMSRGFLGDRLWHHLKPRYLSEVEVISESLGLKGRIDRVMIGEEIIPFELKTREIEKVYDSDEIQLTAYAMLLEDSFKKSINVGILESGNIKHEIQITPNLRKKVLSLIEEIRNLIENPKYPSNFSKCQNCDFKKECDNLK